MDLSGYLLEPLREDGEFVLYRARAKHLEPVSSGNLIASFSTPQLTQERNCSFSPYLLFPLCFFLHLFVVRRLFLLRFPDQ